MTATVTRRDVHDITGRCWVMPQDYINTDSIMPRRGTTSPARAADAGAADRPGGLGGTGPPRRHPHRRPQLRHRVEPAVTLLAQLGIVALVGESISEIFFRNCVSYAMPALELPGVLGMVTEGDTVSVDIGSGRFENVTTGQRAQGAAMPAALLETIAVGGAYVQLRAEGYMGQETGA